MFIYLVAFTDDHVKQMNRRHRHIEGTFTQFFRHPLNMLGDTSSPLRGNMQIFSFNYQQNIRTIITDRFDGEIDYYKTNGFKLSPNDFDSFILRIIFDSIKEADKSTDLEAQEIGEWSFGTGDYLKLLITFQLDGIMKNRGFHTTSETSDRLTGLKSSVLNLRVCSDFATSFNQTWNDWNIDSLAYPDELSTALTMASLKPSQYWLVGFIFNFLWQVKGDNGGVFNSKFSDNSKFREWPVTTAHLEYLLSSRQYVLDSNILVDTTSIKENLLKFLQSTIDRVGDQSIQTELTGWFNDYKTYFTANSLGAKYVMLVKYENMRTCDGSSPEDRFLDKLMSTPLDVYYEPVNRDGFLVALRDMASLSGMSDEPKFTELWYGPSDTFSQNNNVRNPTTPPHISTILPPSAGNPCPSQDCWVYDATTQECALLSNSNCFHVQCDYNDFHLTFQSALFGVEDDESNAFENKAENCSPIWDDDSSQWTWKKELGDCDMAVTKELNSITGDDQFLFAISIVRKSDFNAINGVDSQIALTFQCHYKADIEVESDNWSVAESSLESGFDADGSLHDGFHLDFFHDDTFQDKIQNVDKFYIGSVVYVEANWALHSLSKKINFFLDNCVIQQGSKQVTIVKNNCYASAAHVSNLSPTHLVEEKSRFRHGYESSSF